MTDHYYFTRLRFAGSSGIAKMHGMTVSLTDGPDLGDGPVCACDYRPEIAFARVQPNASDTMRDMRPEEIHAADAILNRLTLMPEVK